MTHSGSEAWRQVEDETALLDVTPLEYGVRNQA
jgi:hypothetical protein